MSFLQAENIATIGYRFQNTSLLRQALTHSSYTAEQKDEPIHNERLEFLGDSVLNLAVAEMLYRQYPRQREGDLSRMRAALINDRLLAGMALKLGLESFLKLGRGERASGGAGKESILAAAFEALVGAIYLDSSYHIVFSFIERLFSPMLSGISPQSLLQKDKKSVFQEQMQERFKVNPVYAIENEQGPDHEKLFTVSVSVGGIPWGYGTAGSKKKAEEQAASNALGRLESEE